MTNNKQFIHNNELSNKRQTWCLLLEEEYIPNKALLYPQAVMQKNEFSNYIDFDNIESYLKGKGYKFIKKKSPTEYIFGESPICDYYKRRSDIAQEWCDNYAEYVVNSKNLCSKHYESD